MNDIFELKPTGKEMAILILAVFILMVVGGSIGYMLGIRQVHDNGSGNAGAGQQIEQAGTDIQHAADGIKEAAGTADQIGSTIKDAKDTAGYIHITAADSAGIISECQSILKGIRSRGKKDQAAH